MHRTSDACIICRCTIFISTRTSKELSMRNNPTSVTGSTAYAKRLTGYIHGIDPASRRANNSHKWELASYLKLKAGDGVKVAVCKRPFKRNESHYENGPIL